MAVSTPPPALHRAHEALLRHSDLQFDFPAFVLPAPPAWLIAFQHWFDKVVGPYLEILFWGVAGLALVAVLFYAGREFWRLYRVEERPVQDIRTAMAAWRPTAAQARALLADADTLAGGGRYDEAVHILLLRSIEDIEQFRPHVVQRAYTAREIEQLGIMPFPVRQAFSGIMQVVEKSLFGGLIVGRDEFLRCRSDYESFAFPDAWRGG